MKVWTFVPLFVIKVAILGYKRTSFPLFIENDVILYQKRTNNGLDVRQHRKKAEIAPNSALNVRST
ncbi:hypothetical protein [Gracilibacillus thailandensis]|uniref:hypothetical protein n=1 Tax=Gracilibacillus thailandensis TaxID=563735 RepID=UPI0013D3B6B4|nr:hypothetical protein [Gracilibacillus thailandensis]